LFAIIKIPVPIVIIRPTYHIIANIHAMRITSAILSVALALGSSPRSIDAFGASRSAHRSSSSFSSSRGGSSSSSRSVATDSSAAASTTEEVASSSSSSSSSSRPSLDPEFRGARDAAIAKLASSLPSQALVAPLSHFVDEYFRALSEAAGSGSGNPDGAEITADLAMRTMMTTLGYGMKYGLGVGNPGGKKFVFEDVRHMALRGPTKVGRDDARYESEGLREMLGKDVEVDFYAAGCDFFRPSMDLRRSLVLGRDNLDRAKAQLDAGENVVFLANHQSEADPQVVSCLLETVSDEISELGADMTYVAGHKVTTDALAIPFSMGRNLLCIHSKKHIDADPLTKPAKSKQNMAAMNSMLSGMKDGGMAIWVAPSGGRDRRDVSTGKIPIAPFDQKTVDMFRLMGNKSRVPTHFYPMSMVSYDLCPPPDFVEAGVGELRNVRYTPVGIAIGDEVPNVGGADQRHLFTEHAERECAEGYVRLLRGMDMESYIP
jgi:glycerol-3-phosphate O-acyltransferase